MILSYVDTRCIIQLMFTALNLTFALRSSLIFDSWGTWLIFGDFIFWVYFLTVPLYVSCYIMGYYGTKLVYRNIGILLPSKRVSKERHEDKVPYPGKPERWESSKNRGFWSKQFFSFMATTCFSCWAHLPFQRFQSPLVRIQLGVRIIQSSYLPGLSRQVPTWKQF